MSAVKLKKRSDSEVLSWNSAIYQYMLDHARKKDGVYQVYIELPEKKELIRRIAYRRTHYRNTKEALDRREYISPDKGVSSRLHRHNIICRYLHRNLICPSQNYAKNTNKIKRAFEWFTKNAKVRKKK